MLCVRASFRRKVLLYDFSRSDHSGCGHSLVRSTQLKENYQPKANSSTIVYVSMSYFSKSWCHGDKQSQANVLCTVLSNIFSFISSVRFITLIITVAIVSYRGSGSSSNILLSLDGFLAFLYAIGLTAAWRLSIQEWSSIGRANAWHLCFNTGTLVLEAFALAISIAAMALGYLDSLADLLLATALVVDAIAGAFLPTLELYGISCRSAHVLAAFCVCSVLNFLDSMRTVTLSAAIDNNSFAIPANIWMACILIKGFQGGIQWFAVTLGAKLVNRTESLAFDPANVPVAIPIGVV
eukprot:gb/GECG01006002.1/.p1 GENE.gb/GECG01006002.1/~~gb/GECG01006002.1/.p1  ORF type:complete len:295 (+),score=15.11 gb/GECG01006002.1/:1-885(+)